MRDAILFVVLALIGYEVLRSVGGVGGIAAPVPGSINSPTFHGLPNINPFATAGGGGGANPLSSGLGFAQGLFSSGAFSSAAPIGYDAASDAAADASGLGEYLI